MRAVTRRSSARTRRGMRAAPKASIVWTVEHDITAHGGTHAIRLSNGDVELIASTDYGPRILRYARCGGANVFGFVDPSEQGNETPFGEPWHIYGGHRLWH